MYDIGWGMVFQTPANLKPQGRKWHVVTIFRWKISAQTYLKGNREEEDICTIKNVKGLLSRILTN